MLKRWISFMLLVTFIFSPLLHATQTATAIFAAGCFWCAEHDFESVPGVSKVISGYTGGHVVNPTYEQVSKGGTGHYEAIEVVYNPKIVSYAQLLNYFWHNVDPTDGNGQFCDHGDQYRSAIFYASKQQQEEAERSKLALMYRERLTVATQILPAATFYPAEEYHQEYAKKNPLRYQFYRYSCGRDKRLREIWGSSTPVSK